MHGARVFGALGRAVDWALRQAPSHGPGPAIARWPPGRAAKGPGAPRCEGRCPWPYGHAPATWPGPAGAGTQRARTASGLVPILRPGRRASRRPPEPVTAAPAVPACARPAVRKGLAARTALGRTHPVKAARDVPRLLRSREAPPVAAVVLVLVSPAFASPSRSRTRARGRGDAARGRVRRDRRRAWHRRRGGVAARQG